MPGRPKEFTREDVLTKAMDVFWRKGYEATSIGDLEKHTGIGRQSIYNEFGDKKGLFQAVASYYDQAVVQVFVDAITATGSPRANIYRWLGMMVTTATDPERQGCLLVKSAMNVGMEDETFLNAATVALGRLEKALRLAMRRSVEAGELPASTDPNSAASYLLSIGQGILVLGRLKHSAAKLKCVVRLSAQIFDV